MSTDLTDERLAEWYEHATRHLNGTAHRVITLIDALRKERQEADEYCEFIAPTLRAYNERVKKAEREIRQQQRYAERDHEAIERAECDLADLRAKVKEIAEIWECDPPGQHPEQWRHRESCAACCISDGLREALGGEDQ